MCIRKTNFPSTKKKKFQPICVNNLGRRKNCEERATLFWKVKNIAVHYVIERGKIYSEKIQWNASLLEKFSIQACPQTILIGKILVRNIKLNDKNYWYNLKIGKSLCEMGRFYTNNCEFIAMASSC